MYALCVVVGEGGPKSRCKHILGQATWILHWKPMPTLNTFVDILYGWVPSQFKPTMSVSVCPFCPMMRMWRKEFAISALQSQDGYLVGSTRRGTDQQQPNPIASHPEDIQLFRGHNHYMKQQIWNFYTKSSFVNKKSFYHRFGDSFSHRSVTSLSPLSVR